MQTCSIPPLRVQVPKCKVSTQNLHSNSYPGNPTYLVSGYFGRLGFFLPSIAPAPPLPTIEIHLRTCSRSGHPWARAGCPVFWFVSSLPRNLQILGQRLMGYNIALRMRESSRQRAVVRTHLTVVRGTVFYRNGFNSPVSLRNSRKGS